MFAFTPHLLTFSLTRNTLDKKKKKRKGKKNKNCKEKKEKHHRKGGNKNTKNILNYAKKFHFQNRNFVLNKNFSLYKKL